MPFPREPFKGNFKVGISNPFTQDVEQGMIAPGEPKFLITDNGIFITTDDGKFITTD